MGVQYRPVAGAIGMCMSHHFRSDEAIEISNAGMHRGRPTQSPNFARARTATVPVVRGTGTGEGWPPHIQKSSGLKGQDYQPCSPIYTSYLDYQGGWGDKGKVVVPAPKATGNS